MKEEVLVKEESVMKWGKSRGLPYETPADYLECKRKYDNFIHDGQLHLAALRAA